MDAWMNGCMDEWMHGFMHAWMNGCMDDWMNGCMDAWMHGCMDAWMRIAFEEGEKPRRCTISEKSSPSVRVQPIASKL